MTKPHIYKAPGQPLFICSFAAEHTTFHGFGATMREAYMDWCVNVYGARFPKVE